jgi:hypothetical protein
MQETFLAGIANQFLSFMVDPVTIEKLQMVINNNTT